MSFFFSGQAQFDKLRMSYDDIAGVIVALSELKKEIDDYPKDPAAAAAATATAQ